jgi:hypothetical protein
MPVNVAAGGFVGCIMLSNMDKAKTRNSKATQVPLKGEASEIARHRQPEGVLAMNTPARINRRPGSLKGKIWLACDWDSPATKRKINEMMIPMELRFAKADGPVSMRPTAQRQTSQAEGIVASQRKAKR